MASIIIASGDHLGDYYPLGHRTNVIGRSESLLIQVLDEEVSRKHLQIRYDNSSGHYYALDMRSRNGVMINGHRIEDEVRLADGAWIQIGHTELLFTDQDFDDAESALHYFRKVGERSRPTFRGDL